MDLRAALAALEQQLGPGGTASAPAGPWRRERVTVSLALGWRQAGPAGPGWEVLEPAPGPSPVREVMHRVTVEYQWDPGGVADAGAGRGEVGEVGEVGSATGVDGRVGGWLAEALGEPGFDSSARARVLVEAVGSLNPVQQAELLAGLAAPEPLGDEAVERVRHQVLRLLERGPAGGRRGAELFTRAAERAGLAGVLRLLGGRWHTREWWEGPGPGEARHG
ncbi:MAG: hypothetical protein ACKO3N_02690 [Verrucomicrobiota bacterium]